jgi:hypothetical protein
MPSPDPTPVPADLSAVGAGAVGTAARREIHCDDCGHRVNAARAITCAGLVSVVDLTVTTFNVTTARPFVAAPAPYRGHLG